MTDESDLFRFLTAPPIRVGVPGATREDSAAAVVAFCADLAARGWSVAAVRSTGEAVEGRYPYELTFTDGRMLELEMPGLPVEQVRFTGAPRQNPWHYPRLHVDGSSWLWQFALNVSGPPDGKLQR